MYDCKAYRSSLGEKERTEDLLRLLPKSRRSVLDVGARDGHFSKLLTQYFPEVTALDLQKPGFHFPGVTTVAGDATKLDFPDGSFDCVFCAEVLEHIPSVEKACSELVRVARHEVIIGVPYRQDTRIARTLCRSCGRHNPPYGHVNSFDDARLESLFRGLRVGQKSLVGVNREATNRLSCWLMDLAGHPWGTYEQEEPCIYCGAKLSPPAKLNFWPKLCGFTAVQIDRIAARANRPHGNWIHLAFTKTSSPEAHGL